MTIPFSVDFVRLIDELFDCCLDVAHSTGFGAFLARGEMHHDRELLLELVASILCGDPTLLTELAFGENSGLPLTPDFIRPDLLPIFLYARSFRYINMFAKNDHMHLYKMWS